ncbi:MAG TPA: aspartate-semialdehyde dehydrogenase [Gemmatimonadaceae bacterium]|nr:aspartate-semialdehyde dehydrogenase [Gemmatimonadaceae bacterium]
MSVPHPFGGQRLPVAVLGATGMVGQTFIRLLADHPWFRISTVAASERSAGKTFAEATRWLEGDMPASVRDMIVQPCDPTAIGESVVFSALDSGPAQELEPAFARRGAIVLSNAKSYRMAPDVPLLIPEINASHLALLDVQRAQRNWPGAIVTNANCATIVLAMALAPLHSAFGARRLFVATMQAVSGAGYPGVSALDILGNVVPYIGDEEPKLETEGQKILGSFDGSVIAPAPFAISAHTNRVAVEHGHTVCMSVEFEQRPTPQAALDVLRNWRGDDAAHGLPSSPPSPLVVHTALDRPQPRRDVHRDGGMSVHVGRVRSDPQFHLRLVAMGHNVIRGAAGASIQNAELLAARGVIGAA